MTSRRAWVWTAATDALVPERLDPCERWLDEVERSRLARLQVAADRVAFAAAHALLRWALQGVTGVASARQVFVNNAFGRPHWAAMNPPAPALPSFNLSHARGLVAVAIGPGPSVGVDVETSGPRWTERIALARSVLAAREAEWLFQEAEPGPRGERFLRLWTLKEALAKAVGRGVSLAFDSFELTLDPPRLSTAHALLTATGRWRLEQWRPNARGWAALAIDEPLEEPIEIRRQHLDGPSLLAALAQADPAGSGTSRRLLEADEDLAFRSPVDRMADRDT